MSVYGPMFEICCDGCYTSAGVEAVKAKNRTAAWRQAVKKGWRRIGRKDKCPTCVELIERPL